MNESVRIELEDPRAARSVFGHREEHLKLLADELTVDIHSRGTRLSIEGDPVDAAIAEKVVRQLYRLARGGHAVVSGDVVRAAQMLRETPGSNVGDVFTDTIIKAPGGKSISPKTKRQKEYVDAIRSNDIVFGVGPAGTGKTYLAMAMAVSYLTRKQVKRIILTRPAVEAGEKLGFLPGDLKDKVSPYLRPLYDALFDMLDVDRATEMLERGIIEVAPLAFMRGRTLSDAFVILDEAQNATRQQMKMFLTRLGFDSRTVITGDVTQIDLEQRGRSGLGHAVRLLETVPGIEVSRFTEVDVVRHPLVRRIITAYEKAEALEDQRPRSAKILDEETTD